MCEEDKEERDRFEEVLSYEVLDTAPEAAYDDIVQLASRICRTPISLISLVADSRQWFKAKVGLNVPETPRCVSFCDHAIKAGMPLVIPDARVDDRFKSNPLVLSDPNIVFYAGVPLETSSGNKMGTICVLDTISREITEDQLGSLRVLASHVSKLIENRKHSKQIQQLTLELPRKNAEIQKRIDFHQKLVSIIGFDLLASIRSLEDLYESQSSGDLTRKEWEDLSCTIRESRAWLDSLLSWAACQESPWDNEPTNIRKAVEEEIHRIDNLAKMKGNIMVVEIDSKLELRVNPQLVTFICRTFIEYSMKRASRGRLGISCQTYSDGVLLTFEDDGSIISPEMQKSLFDSVKRQTAMSTQSGFGIGFKLVNSSVMELEGRITIQSEVDKGSKFNVILPISLLADQS